MASLLRSRGVDPELVLDEGGALVQGLVPGLDRPLALVRIAEKSYVSLELSVKVEGGHSSMPPAHTAIGILGRAVSQLEDKPMAGRLDSTARRMLEAMAPELPFGPRLALANLWLFGPVVERMMLRTPAMAAAACSNVSWPPPRRPAVSFRVARAHAARRTVQFGEFVLQIHSLASVALFCLVAVEMDDIFSCHSGKREGF